MHIHENAFFGASRDTEKAKNLVYLSTGRAALERLNSIVLAPFHHGTARHGTRAG
jgi:hypothetical protein